MEIRICSEKLNGLDHRFPLFATTLKDETFFNYSNPRSWGRIDVPSGSEFAGQGKCRIFNV